MIVLTAVTLITLDSRRGDEGALGAVGRAAHTVVSPFEDAVDSVADPVGDWFDGLTDGTSLKRENERLRARIGELEDERRTARGAIDENEEFRELLDQDINSEIDQVTSRVVNASIGNFEWTITLAKGSESGIAPDMPVIGPEGLVGKVLEAWSGGSKVRLLIDSDSSVAVHVLAQDGEQVGGNAEGRAGTNLLRVDLDEGAAVAVGDWVVTSGLENSVFPANLNVGEVVSVDEQPTGLGPVVRVDPWTDFGGLEYVTVLRWFNSQTPDVVTTSTTTTVTTAPTSTIIVADDAEEDA
ncbi:MAG: rod shape-determining protein MreC [Actinomycetota bacterium]